MRDSKRESLFAAFEQLDDGCLIEASGLLNGFAQAIYEGREFPTRLRIESTKYDGLTMMDRERVLELLTEIGSNEVEDTT